MAHPHPLPLPEWYVYAREASAPVRLLADDGHPLSGLASEPAQVLALLAAVIHATAWRLDEVELRTLERFVALQRWRRI